MNSIIFVKTHLINPDNPTNFLKGRVQERYLKTHFPEELRQIYKDTSFLSEQASLIERLWCIVGEYTSIPLCKCGQPVKFQKSIKRYAEFCSSNCPYATQRLQENLKKHLEETYGVSYAMQVPENKEKAKKTFIKRYGVDNPNKSKDIRKKIENTLLTRYGGKAPACNEEIKKKIRDTWNNKTKEELEDIQTRRTNTFKELNKNKEIDKKVSDTWNSKSKEEIELIVNKRKKTNLEKYGVDNPAKTLEVQQKLRSNYENKAPEAIEEEHRKYRETCIKKYGVNNVNQRHLKVETLALRKNDEEYRKFLIQKHHKEELTLSEIAKDLEIDNTLIGLDCKRLGIDIKAFYRSCPEKEISNYIETIDSEQVLLRDRTAIKEELDIYIPTKNLALEVNGLYWHSYDTVPTPNERNRHRRKTIKCREAGIRLFHIFENEWNNPLTQDIWKSIIAHNLGKTPIRIYARNTAVRELGGPEAIQFLNENHIQGSVASTKYYGLFSAEKLVSVISFTKYKDNIWELSRLCNKKYTSVIGGASKLLNYFEKNNTWSEIFTFADLRYSYGLVYKNLEFQLADEIGIRYYYTDRKNLFHRRGFQKQNLRKKLGDLYDPTLTEFENILGRTQYRIIYDCGKLKFTKSNEHY